MKRVFVSTVAILACLGGGLRAEVRLPKYTRQELPNGAVAILMPRPGIPLVQFRVVVKGGTESEPAGQTGIAVMTAQLLRKGAGTKTADAFSDELDGLGGTFTAFTNEESSVIQSEFLRKDFEQGLSLTADAVLRPTFPDDEVKKLVSQTIDRVKSTKDNPQAAISLYFRAFFYGPNHPYGRVPEEAMLATLTRQNVAAYHKDRYVGRNLIIVVSGDFDAAAAGPAIAKAFGAAPAGTAYEWKPDAKPLPGGRLLLIDKPDATQTYFEIAQPGIRRTDSDLTGLTLLNTLFGGRFTSMLNDELRVNTGLTYGARSTVSQTAQPGAISISTFTRTETTERAMDLALEVLKRFHDKGISAEQLASAKAYVKGTLPPQRLETPDQLAAAVSDIELYGLNRGEIDDMFSRIDAMTLERADALIKKRFSTDQLTFVVLGNAEKIRGAMKKYAPQVVEVSIKSPGFSAK